jgi:hypothetical protein
MRHFIVDSLIALIVLLSVGLALSRPESVATNDSPARPSVLEAFSFAPEAAPRTAPVQTVRGAIIGIEKELARFTVLTADERPLMIQMELKTSLRLSGNEVEIWDLKLGDRVTVTFISEHGRNIARAVTVER